MSKFLPHVVVTTIVWADEDMLKHSQWEAAQGDDLKNQRSTIELNLPKLAQRGNSEAIAQGIVESWLSIYIVLATRQDLINKEVRGDVSGEAEEILCKANLEAVLESPILRRRYADLAIAEILSHDWHPDKSYHELCDKVRATLLTWKEFSEQLDTFANKCWLCKKQFLGEDASPREHLDFVTETPYAKIMPSPFIDTIVWVCQTCLPLARQIGLDAKPLEI